MLNNDWDLLLKSEFQKEYFKRLTEHIKKEYEIGTCFPPMNQVFHALRKTSYQDTKVLILGQDPYHNPGQAMGLAFSVPKGMALPPSLRNIFQELSTDLGVAMPKNGDLTKWTEEGVLLLNSILSVRQNQPLSHQNQGWETLTDEIIKLLNEKVTPIVFILWGSFARSKKKFITNRHHLVIENVHPSPLSVYRGFFGSKPFSKVNQFLMNTSQQPIDFTL